MKKFVLLYWVLFLTAGVLASCNITEQPKPAAVDIKVTTPNSSIIEIKKCADIDGYELICIRGIIYPGSGYYIPDIYLLRDKETGSLSGTSYETGGKNSYSVPVLNIKKRNAMITKIESMEKELATMKAQLTN